MFNLKQQKGLLSQHIINKHAKFYITLNEKMNKHNDMVRINNSYMRLNIPFSLKSTYNSIIPLNLYTCWHTKDLPPLMKQNYEKLIKDNPEFHVYLYDEDECREFIQTHFSQRHDSFGHRFSTCIHGRIFCWFCADRDLVLLRWSGFALL